MPDDILNKLVKDGVVSKDQLHEAQHLASSLGIRAEEALIKLGYVDPNEISNLQASKFGFETVNLNGYEIPPSVVEMVPESVARENVVIPLSLEGEALTVAIVFLTKAKVSYSNFNAVSIENSHDDGLSMNGRQNADAEIKLLPAGTSLNPPVLAPPLFSDVHIGHNFQSRHQCCEKASWWAVSFNQHTINSISNAYPCCEWLNVNVAGTHTYCFGDN